LTDGVDFCEALARVVVEEPFGVRRERVEEHCAGACVVGEVEDFLGERVVCGEEFAVDGLGGELGVVGDGERGEENVVRVCVVRH
jgi:hypothetical protein